tara:strand:+ start:135 stop:1115 length:981 start_codon:yes stop_codon:yes gene_type:complete
MKLAQFKFIFLYVLRNKWVQAGTGLLVSSFLTILAIEKIDWIEISTSLKAIPIHTLLIVLIPIALTMVLRAMRWYLLLPDENIKFVDVLLIQNTGMGVNNISPIRMISEPIQLALITKNYNVGFSKAFTGLVGGNFLDVIASALVITFGVALLPSLRDQAISIPIVGAFILFSFSTLVFIAIARGIHKLAFWGRFQYFQEVVNAANLLKDRPWNLTLAFLATLSHWVVLGLAGWILMSSFGMEISLVAMTAILVAATFFTAAIPSAPTGMGTFHFAVTTMLVALGENHSIAFGFSIVMHLFTVLPSSAIALIMVWRLGARAILERK